MPASGRPDADAPASEAGEEPSLDSLLDRVGDGVERLASAYLEARRRAAELERQHGALREAVTAAGNGEAPAGVEERLSRLASENRRLRETLEEARGRAERIRSRLEVVEDEI